MKKSRVEEKACIACFPGLPYIPPYSTPKLLYEKWSENGWNTWKRWKSYFNMYNLDFNVFTNGLNIKKKILHQKALFLSRRLLEYKSIESISDPVFSEGVLFGFF